MDKSGSESNISVLIAKYKKHIEVTHLKDEVYKWELVSKFKGRPNLDADDLSEEIKSIKYTNLIYFNALSVIHFVIKEKPEGVRLLLKMLFDESVDLSKRIFDFTNKFSLTYKEVDGKHQHHQDERTIACYLTFYNPEKYTFYKHSFYKKLCELLKIKEAKKNEKYPHYLELLNQIIKDYIQHDNELIEQVKSYIPEYYDGSNNLLLAQDILYQMLDKHDKNEYINVKEQFVDWMIANDSDGRFYFLKQFGSNKERFQKEINSYETVYKDYFKKELFIIDISNIADSISILRTNIYDKNNAFSKFSKERASGRPMAILGKNNYLQFLENHFKSHESSALKSPEMTYKAPLNQILYGPPGTGKTYHTVLEAAKIVTGNKNISYDDALQIFNDNLGSQIEFITFHQNYSYEDFIQGLRPDTENGTALTFEKKDGVFKRIADRALFEYYIEIQKNKSKSNEIYLDINEVYLDFYNSLKVGQEFSTKTNVTIKIIQLNENKNIVFKYENGNKPVLVSSNRLLKLFSKVPDIKLIKNINEDVRAAIGGCDSTIYYTILKEFINFYTESKERIENNEEYQDFDYLEISELRKKEILSQISIDDLREINSNFVKNYVIIIDEINRANISRVFGELITLIEEDKRSHGKIPMRVTLPSGDSFIVPSNLHIIGTMNTADKSIALLDIALRRRFDFVPKYPNFNLASVNDREILEGINKAILDRKNHDFTIGHAYFMGDDYSREKTINNKVIPLLLECFMNDEKEVIAIMKSANLTIGDWPLRLLY